MKLLGLISIVVVELGNQLSARKVQRVYFRPDEETSQAHHVPVGLLVFSFQVKYIPVQCIDCQMHYFNQSLFSFGGLISMVEITS